MPGRVQGQSTSAAGMGLGLGFPNATGREYQYSIKNNDKKL